MRTTLNCPPILLFSTTYSSTSSMGPVCTDSVHLTVMDLESSGSTSKLKSVGGAGISEMHNNKSVKV